MLFQMRINRVTTQKLLIKYPSCSFCRRNAVNFMRLVRRDRSRKRSVKQAANNLYLFQGKLSDQVSIVVEQNRSVIKDHIEICKLHLTFSV